MKLGLNIAFLEISWVDVIDVSLVAILLYQVYKLIKGSLALNIFIGLLSLYLIFLIVRAAGMELLSTILGQFMGIGVLAMLILFQQEIRRFLLVIGRSAEINRETLIKPFMGWHDQQHNFDIREVVEAIKVLQATRTGALIMFSRDSEMKFYVETGDTLDAKVSRRLLVAIFNKNSPLHDGAIIVYKGKIKAARCVLPVSENENLPPQYGLRHRAAIGASETTGSLVVAVSEETGHIVVAKAGNYVDDIPLKQAEQIILDYMADRDIPILRGAVPTVSS